MPPKPVLAIYGLVYDPEFHACVQIAENLEKDFGYKENITYEYHEFFERQFAEFLNDKRKETKCADKMYADPYMPLIIYKGKIGRSIDYMTDIASEFNKRYYIKDNKTFLFRASRAFKEKIRKNGGIAVYQDIKIGDKRPQKIIYLLNIDVCPLAANNFKCLCTGEKGGKLKYKGTPFHRVVRDGWVQGGDIVSGGGDGGWSIYGEHFNDESFSKKFDSAGVLAYANDGPHTNSSQFFITLDNLSWMNEKAVAFGEVIQGLDTVKDIGDVPLANERPIDDCYIESCGLFSLEFTDEEVQDLKTYPSISKISA